MKVFGHEVFGLLCHFPRSSVLQPRHVGSFLANFINPVFGVSFLMVLVCSPATKGSRFVSRCRKTWCNQPTKRISSAAHDWLKDPQQRFAKLILEIIFRIDWDIVLKDVDGVFRLFIRFVIYK